MFGGRKSYYIKKQRKRFKNIVHRALVKKKGKIKLKEMGFKVQPKLYRKKREVHRDKKNGRRVSRISRENIWKKKKV